MVISPFEISRLGYETSPATIGSMKSDAPEEKRNLPDAKIRN
jgi:hypothetical protein